MEAWYLRSSLPGSAPALGTGYLWSRPGAGRGAKRFLASDDAKGG